MTVDTDDIDNSENTIIDNLVEQSMERVQRDQEELESEENTDANQTVDVDTKRVWFYKLEVLINHIRDVSCSLIHILGSFLSLDEMMIRFSGRSIETHRIKNKPIGEGFNFLFCAPLPVLLLILHLMVGQQQKEWNKSMR